MPVRHIGIRCGRVVSPADITHHYGSKGSYPVHYHPGRRSGRDNLTTCCSVRVERMSREELETLERWEHLLGERLL